MSEMLNNVNTNIERIIAKIDNDFNPDNSDWIPRVGAWCIDAMSQLDILPTKRKKKKLIVKDRIAYSECAINNTKLKVFDNNGCEIKEANKEEYCSDCPSTGRLTSETSDSITELTPDTIDIINIGQQQAPNYVIAETKNDKYPFRYNVHHFVIGDNNSQERNYVLVDCDKIEINFDANFIYIETEFIETTCSQLFNCELPVIPNNGLLIEAIAYYCIYKMLCRGYKHPVFNLAASQYGTNPYYNWIQLKEEAKRSVINNNVDDASKLFRSTLFIDTFDPRK
nr:MAG TPA: hypothetical protein [Crassvirales sp.]